MKHQALNFRRLRALIWKEGIQIINDPSSILIAFVLPVILLFLFGYAVSLDSTHLRIGIALAERSPESAGLVRALSDSKYFEIKTSLDRRALETDLVAGRLRGVIVIPSDFSQNLGRPGEEPSIQVIADGSEPNDIISVCCSLFSSERADDAHRNLYARHRDLLLSSNSIIQESRSQKAKNGSVATMESKPAPLNLDS
jgi:hypothetical protein